MSQVEEEEEEEENDQMQRQNYHPEETSTSLSSSEAYLFAEATEAFGCIDSLSSSSSSLSLLSRRHSATALLRLRTIFDKYLECPTLLDAALERMVTNLAASVLIVLQQQEELEQQQPQVDTTTSSSTTTHSTTTTTTTTPSTIATIRFALSALYALSKVRGRKTVQRFLPHGVHDVEPVWNALLVLLNDTTNDDEHDDDDDEALLPPRWESIYMLWNWMGVLSLVPFDCVAIAGIGTSSRDHDTDKNQQQHQCSSSTLPFLLVQRAKAALAEASPVRDAAAACLASWLSRPDLEREQLLPAFLQWTLQIINNNTSSTKNNNSSNSSNLFQLLGALQTITTILKTSPIAREKLVLQLNTFLWDPILQLADHDSGAVDNNLLLQKLLVKWWTRSCCAYLPPPRMASWRYQRGARSSSSLAASHTTKNTNANNNNVAAPDQKENDESPTAAAAAQQQQETSSSLCNELFHVPDQVEEGMGRLIQALGNRSTMVRWSAAKGIGRVCERLPAICAQDVLDAVLEYLENADDEDENERKDNHWHGACLALAELARRGLLLPSRLEDVVPRIVVAVQYDVQRQGNHQNSNNKSVGAHVRDAACYTFWAFSRAYSPVVLRPYMRELSEAIVITSLLDREVNCRRAASAAFQEAVGRQGAVNFPHGIDIITTADYFSLGNRKDAYTSIAKQVASFADYRRPILRHLYRKKQFHWDPNIRTLTAQSLYTLTDLDPSFVGGVIVPSLMEKSLDPTNLHVRHGAVLGVASTILALAEINQLNSVLSDKSKADLAVLVPTIEKKRLYRGRGGEIMRSAVCRLVECISVARIHLTVQQQVSLLDSVDASIPHPSGSIQTSACLALHQLMSTYFPVHRENGPSARLQSRVVDTFVRHVNTSENPAATRGYALALGYLPAKLVAPSKTVLESILECLCKTARYDSLVGGESDAETRRNALLSISRISETVCKAAGRQAGYPVVSLESSLMAQMFDTFLFALEDYMSDRRGDVGSWCRMAAMDGLVSLVFHATGCNADCCNDTTMTLVVAALLKQLSEKLDTLRQRAGDCLQTILQSVEPSIPGIPFKCELIAALGFTSETVSDDRSWTEASFAFPKVMRAASLGVDAYFANAIAGISISIGGLTESVSKSAKSALLEWVSQCESTDGMIEKLCICLLSLLNDNRGQIRVLLPVLKTLNLLLVSRGLDEELQSNRTDFSSSFQKALVNVEKGCDDMHCLLVVVDVAVGLVFSLEDVDSKRRSVAFLCKLLVHRYPRIRSHTAEQLYMVVLEHSDLMGGDDEGIGETILSTPWASDLQELRKVTENIATRLGVTTVI